MSDFTFDKPKGYLYSGFCYKIEESQISCGNKFYNYSWSINLTSSPSSNFKYNHTVIQGLAESEEVAK